MLQGRFAMYVCVCNAVTESQVREAIAGGATTLEDLQMELGVATCCGTCSEVAATYLTGTVDTQPPAVIKPLPATLADAPPVRWVARGPRRATVARLA